MHMLGLHKAYTFVQKSASKGRGAGFGRWRLWRFSGCASSLSRGRLRAPWFSHFSTLRDLTHSLARSLLLPCSIFFSLFFNFAISKSWNFLINFYYYHHHIPLQLLPGLPIFQQFSEIYDFNFELEYKILLTCNVALLAAMVRKLLHSDRDQVSMIRILKQKTINYYFVHVNSETLQP